MAGFFSKIFGAFSSGSGDAPANSNAAMQRIGDYSVFATPIREGGQYRLAGRIEKETADGILVRNFIRADQFSSESDAVETTFRKAQQIIEQNGPSLFADGAAQRQV